MMAWAIPPAEAAAVEEAVAAAVPAVAAKNAAIRAEGEVDQGAAGAPAAEGMAEAVDAALAAAVGKTAPARQVGPCSCSTASWRDFR